MYKYKYSLLAGSQSLTSFPGLPPPVFNLICILQVEVANEARETCNCESLNWDTEPQGPDAGIIPQSYTVTLVAMDGWYLAS